tara:strand:- start:525 stop:797 length:273 start_codon:yes stop_codon:yes gene_type:complete
MEVLLDQVDQLYQRDTTTNDTLNRMNKLYESFFKEFNCSPWQIEMAAKEIKVNLDNYPAPDIEKSKLFIKLTYLMNGNTINEYLQDGFKN